MKKNLFHSAQPFSYPNTTAYESQKKVKLITTRPRHLKYFGILVQPEILWGYPLWDFYCKRLELAMTGKGLGHLTHFPGCLVPGMNSGTRNIGSLTFEKFISVLNLSGGFPHPGTTENESFWLEDAQGCEWLWDKVPRPRLQVLHPKPSSEIAPIVRIAEYLHRLEHELEIMVHQDRIPVQKILSFVRRAWSPDTIIKWSGKSIAITKELIQQAKCSREQCNWLAFCFEVENFVFRMQYSEKLHLHSYGRFNGCWVEVGQLSLGQIHTTELCITERVLTELINVREKGFAPIIVNEYNSDTDGTHRLTAAWLWNLLRYVYLQGENFDLKSQKFQHAVYKFVQDRKSEMGPVMSHEILRVLQEILCDLSMEHKLKTSVLPHLAHYRYIDSLPVSLLPEYSCGAVLKGLYDEGDGAHRVNPMVYEFLSKNRHVVLPPRGPYHLTDRAILPWFQILKLI